MTQEEKDKMKLKRIGYIEVTGEFVGSLAIATETQRIFKTIEGLPEDAEVVRVSYDDRKNVFRVYVESKQFDLIAEGWDIPRVGQITTHSLETVEDHDRELIERIKNYVLDVRDVHRQSLSNEEDNIYGNPQSVTDSRISYEKGYIDGLNAVLLDQINKILDSMLNSNEKSNENL